MDHEKPIGYRHVTGAGWRMRLFLMILLTLLAFAANSVLNRAALAGGEIGPGAFTGLRLLSGAVVLSGLALAGGVRLRGSPLSALALLAYAIFFSFAYLALDAGLGALVLFGMVQITMFGGALWAGQKTGQGRWIGSGLGLAGLAMLLLPGTSAPDPWSLGLMAMAGIAWGVYSLRGQRAGPPLAETAGNFVWATPLAVLLWLLMPGAGDISMAGAALAIASGALASGLGYALWYRVLPQIDASLAAIAQLTVPLIALAGGIVFLGEKLTMTFLVASVLILGGVALAVLRPDGFRQK